MECWWVTLAPCWLNFDKLFVSVWDPSKIIIFFSKTRHF